MVVLITGTSRGIGREAALRFIRDGHTVIGMDVCDSTIDLPGVFAKKYIHYKLNVATDPSPTSTWKLTL